jgi:alkylation response protein AidB-like acyl-CoA dehydrogenase
VKKEVPVTPSTPRDQADRLRTIDALGPAFAARAKELDAAAAFPVQNFADLRAAGLLALTLDERWGGAGLWSGQGFVHYYELLERLATWDTSTAQLLQVHSHAIGILSRAATPEQAEKYLVPIAASGQLVASVGSESKPASARSGLYTSELEPAPGGGWILSCEKHFASLGPGADQLMLWIAVPGEGDYAARTVLILVPRDAPEVELLDEWDTLGMRSTVSWGVRVSGYRVPADAIFGVPGDWVTGDPRTFTLGFTANHVGAAQAALDFAVGWVRERPNLATSELVQFTLGDLAADIHAARSALYAAARVWETGDFDQAELDSQMALHVAKRVVLATTQRVFEVAGARSAFRSLPLEQMYRDARTFTLHFRDELYTRDIGRALVSGSYRAKAHVDGTRLPAALLPPEQTPPAPKVNA